MTHSRLTFLGLLVLVVLLVIGKLAWDDYQQERASLQLPEVIRIIDSLELPTGTVQIGDSTTSTNEYATSVWRHHRNNMAEPELRQWFHDQAELLGFRFSSESLSYGGPLICYRHGEYELRLLIDANPKNGSNLAISANWYGGDR